MQVRKKVSKKRKNYIILVFLSDRLKKVIRIFWDEAFVKSRKVRNKCQIFWRVFFCSSQLSIKYDYLTLININFVKIERAI